MSDIRNDLAVQSTDNNILKRLDDLERRITGLQNMSIKADTLDEISSDMGIITAGGFVATEMDSLPGEDDFTGTFMDATGFEFNDDMYHIGGVSAGQLMWGGNSNTGKFTAGGGALHLDEDGISVIADEDYTTTVRSYKFTDADGVEEGGLYGVAGTAASNLNVNLEVTDKNAVTVVNARAIGSANEYAQTLLWARGANVVNYPGIVISSQSGQQDAITINYNEGDVDFIVNSDDQEGILKVDAATNVITIGASGASFSSNGIIYSGTYTPTLYNTTNIDASTAFVCRYIRIGNMVIVSGQVNIDATATTATVLGMSLPIASTLSNAYELSGSGANAENVSIRIYGDTTNNRALFGFTATSTANRGYNFTFTYQII